MPDDVAIRIESLSKRYTIGHQAANGRYVALRDVLVQNTRSFWRKAKDVVRGKPLVLGDQLEEVWALRDVNLEVLRGEVVGIIGRNGAGKSTLLKILSRITEPTSGRVTITGRVASLLEVGTGFHPELTGRQNIYLNGAILGMSRAEVSRKFDEIVDFSGVEKYLDTPVKRYSSGMHVRLAFSVAAHLEPEILLVDEVLTVGDAAFQKKCLGKMGDVASEGRTVLFVSHNMPAVMSLCTKVLHVSSGQVYRCGEEVRDIIEDYLRQASQSGHDVYLRSQSNRPLQNATTLFERCAILNSQGEVTGNLRFGEPFRVQLTLRASSDVDCTDVALVVGIDSERRDRITTAISSTTGAFFHVSAEHSTSIEVSFVDLVLYPGEYLITVAARTSGIALDTLWYVLGFSVLEVPYQDREPHDGSWGIVKTKAVWRETAT